MLVAPNKMSLLPDSRLGRAQLTEGFIKVWLRNENFLKKGFVIFLSIIVFQLHAKFWENLRRFPRQLVYPDRQVWYYTFAVSKRLFFLRYSKFNRNYKKSTDFYWDLFVYWDSFFWPAIKLFGLVAKIIKLQTLHINCEWQN